MTVICIKDYHMFGDPEKLSPSDRPLYPIVKGNIYTIKINNDGHHEFTQPNGIWAFTMNIEYDFTRFNNHFMDINKYRDNKIDVIINDL